MKIRHALQTVFWISLAGLLFSGYLSYSELFKGVCSIGGCSYVLGAPACVYGFVMYSVVFVISWIGLKSRN